MYIVFSLLKEKINIAADARAVVCRRNGRRRRWIRIGNIWSNCFFLLQLLRTHVRNLSINRVKEFYLPTKALVKDSLLQQTRVSNKLLITK